jgi:hypothetical protein
MNGIQIEYLLGLYFIISSVKWEAGKFVADPIRIVAGIILLILAIIGKAFIA